MSTIRDDIFEAFQKRNNYNKTVAESGSTSFQLLPFILRFFLLITIYCALLLPIIMFSSIYSPIWMISLVLFAFWLFYASYLEGLLPSNFGIRSLTSICISEAEGSSSASVSAKAAASASGASASDASTFRPNASAFRPSTSCASTSASKAANASSSDSLEASASDLSKCRKPRIRRASGSEPLIEDDSEDNQSEIVEIFDDDQSELVIDAGVRKSDGEDLDEIIEDRRLVDSSSQPIGNIPAASPPPFPNYSTFSSSEDYPSTSIQLTNAEIHPQVSDSGLFHPSLCPPLSLNDPPSNERQFRRLSSSSSSYSLPSSYSFPSFPPVETTPLHTPPSTPPPPPLPPSPPFSYEGVFTVALLFSLLFYLISPVVFASLWFQAQVLVKTDPEAYLNATGRTRLPVWATCHFDDTNVTKVTATAETMTSAATTTKTLLAEGNVKITTTSKSARDWSAFVTWWSSPTGCPSQNPIHKIIFGFMIWFPAFLLLPVAIVFAVVIFIFVLMLPIALISLILGLLRHLLSSCVQNGEQRGKSAMITTTATRIAAAARAAATPPLSGKRKTENDRSLFLRGI